MNNIYPIILDVKRPRERTDIFTVQHDNGMTVLDIALNEGNQDFEIGERTVQVAFLRPDGGLVVYEDMEVTKKGINGISVALNNNVLSTQGIVYAQVKLKSGENTLSMPKIKLLVDCDVIDSGVPGTPQYTELEKLIIEAEKVIEEIRQAKESLANVDALKAELEDINNKILENLDKIESNILISEEMVTKLQAIILETNQALENLEAKQGDIEALKQLIVKADELNTALIGLNESIAEGKKVKIELDSSIATATTRHEDLTALSNTALQTNQTLGETDTLASATDKTLKETSVKAEGLQATIAEIIESGTILDASLKTQIEQGKSIGESLKASIESANANNTSLSGTINSANEINTTLTSTNQLATENNTSLQAVLSEAKLTEEKLLEIIAQGDLDKYVTDVKLIEELKPYLLSSDFELKIKDYATLNDLAAIDVSGQLAEYEKTTEVDRKLGEVNTETDRKIGEVKTSIENSLSTVAKSGDYGDLNNLPVLLTNKDITDEIAKIIGEAPEALDTLFKVAKALGDDPNFSETILTALGSKVEKKDGYQLSKNDYTDVAKSKVEAIPANPKYTDTTYEIATALISGLMSAADKKKLDGVEEGANKYIHPSVNHIPTGGSVGQVLEWVSSGVAKWGDVKGSWIQFSGSIKSIVPNDCFFIGMMSVGVLTFGVNKTNGKLIHVQYSSEKLDIMQMGLDVTDWRMSYGWYFK